ncbi:MAG: hypothetical protein AAFY52_02050 [Pseudomonadota bacterium]
MPLPDSFATTGFCATSVGRHKIQRFQVLGERGSGTNYITKILTLNTSLKPTDMLGWKHGFPHMLAVPFDMAVICMVRRADNWARSLFETPWHSTARVQALPFSDFIRAPWDTVIDKPKYFKGVFQPMMRMAPLQHDRHPLTGAMFENVFALRQAKVSALVSMLGRDCPVVFLRMEEFQADPQASLAAICDALGTTPRDEFTPFLRRQGWRFKSSVPQRPSLPDAWSDDDYAFLKSSVDPEQEAQLGYSYTDPPAIRKRHITPEWTDD